MYFLYDIGIALAGIILRFLSMFNEKISLFVKGRKETFQHLEQHIDEGDRTLWFHCASLGEFEQGRPVIEEMAARHPEHKIVLSFFSPSGYEIQKNFSLAEAVVYLPLDSKRNARRFLDLVHPDLIVFVKYEFWPNLLEEIRKRKLEAVLISAIFREDQIFFRSYGSWMRKALKGFGHFFVQNEESRSLLNSIGIDEVTLSGDTRFDRVQAILEQDNSLDFLEMFVSGRKILVAGSTWPRDEELLVHFINGNEFEDLAVVIAPHQMDRERMRKMQDELKVKTLLYSDGVPDGQTKVFIVDTIGLLTRIYSYADIALVGGGFDREGVHNVLEPAVFGVPIIIGPVYDKYQEAVDLVEREGCLVANDQQQMNGWINRLVLEDAFRMKSGKACRDYILENTGSTRIIVDFLDGKV